MLIAGGLGVPSTTHALPVTVQDDALMLHRAPAQVKATADRMAELGADRVRLTASWFQLAPNRRSTRMPDFDATRSGQYPREPWRRLDNAVKASVEAGLDVQIDVAFFAPRWAVKRGAAKTHPRHHRWEPNRHQFARFAEAVARRYDGTHRDPTSPGEWLPVVRLWTTWNEPNHPQFLLPQWQRSHGRWVPHSPHFYRRMHQLGYAAIKRVDDDNQVLIGGTAAVGHTRTGPRRGIPPLRFVRELACVDKRDRPLRRPECKGFRPLKADGYSHHPYTLYARPDARSIEGARITLRDLDRLSRLLDDLYYLNRIADRLPIYVTEYGYETNPPDVVRGVTPLQQARYHGLATYMTWKQDDVALFAQFLMNDIGRSPGRDDPLEIAQNWNSGLYFQDGRPKPAVDAFKLPFWAESRTLQGNDVVVLFGQVRPNVGRERIEVEMRAPDGSWVPVQNYEGRPAGDPDCDADTSFLTDTEGFYLRLAPYQGPGRYRARWIKDDGTTERTVDVRVGRPRPAEGP
jgi:hypothetical protein